MAFFYASNAWIVVSPLSVTSKVSDGRGSAFSMMPCTKSALDVSFSCVTKGLNMRWSPFSVFGHVLSGFATSSISFLLLQVVASDVKLVARGFTSFTVWHRTA